MSRWRQQALLVMPDLRGTIESADNVMALWIELHVAFERAYESAPPDEELIRRIYGYALWSLEQRNADVVTAASVAFFEHLPTHPAVRADLHRWIEPARFRDLEGAFRYFLDEE